MPEVKRVHRIRLDWRTFSPLIRQEPLIIGRAARGEVIVILESGIRGAGYLVDRVVENARHVDGCRDHGDSD